MAIFLDTSSSTRRDGQTQKQGEGVASTGLAYDRQEARWDLTNSLRGGADSMRDDGVKWLAMEPGEKLPEYRIRLGRTHLLGAYDDTIEKLTAKPFSQDVTLMEADTLPDMLQAMIDDPDLQGSSITTFFRQAFDTGIDRGLHHVLVDFAPVGGGLNALQERDMGVHPYFVHINPDQLIGWRFKRSGTGRRILTQVRIKTTEVELLENFGEQEVQYIRIVSGPTDPVLDDDGTETTAGELGTWEVWRLDPTDDEWQQHIKPTTHTYPGVPLVTAYYDRVGELEARPPLWRLAELNLEHWQKKSDQDNLLHVARVPILFRAGWTAAELKKGIVVGGNRSIGTTQKDATMSFVEHSGRALGAGQEDLDKIEEQMERMGLDPLLRRAASSLATNIMVGDAKETNLLQAWASTTEMMIVECFLVAATWVGEELPDGFTADIFSEFGLSARATENLKALDTARARGDLSRETYLNELKRYAALSAAIDTEEEMERIEDEGTQMAAVGVEDDELDDDIEDDDTEEDDDDTSE